MSVAINNQCPNIKLTSPIYFTTNTTCNIQFPQQVDFKSIVKVNFKSGMDQDTFSGVLLYRLQRKVNTSIRTQLLVIWGWNSYDLYSYAHLIEHESILVWNNDKLKMLYDAYNSQYDRDIIEEWLLDDNTKLKAKCEISHGGLEINIIISEEKHISSHGKPLWIDSKR
jgi:hypothetical protein